MPLYLACLDGQPIAIQPGANAAEANEQLRKRFKSDGDYHCTEIQEGVAEGLTVKLEAALKDMKLTTISADDRADAAADIFMNIASEVLGIEYYAVLVDGAPTTIGLYLSGDSAISAAEKKHGFVPGSSKVEVYVVPRHLAITHIAEMRIIDKEIHQELRTPPTSINNTTSPWDIIMWNTSPQYTSPPSAKLSELMERRRLSTSRLIEGLGKHDKISKCDEHGDNHV